jgi:hypothetical protein
MSNTRALTPPTASHVGPRLLQSGVDALVIAFRGNLMELELSRMARAANGARTGFEVAGELFELAVTEGRSLRFLLRNAACTVVVARDADDFCVSVEFRALHLRTTPLAAVFDDARRVAGHYATSIVEERVRRVDLCADATGLTFQREDEDRCVTRARRKVRFQAPERSFTRKRSGEQALTGFVIAPKNPLSVRIYDKPEELLSQQGPDSEKTRTEFATYLRQGWDGASPVWRVEAQLRSPVLKELGVRLPVDLARSLDSVWRYVVGSASEEEAHAWLRFVEPGTSTRLERCATDPRWRTYQEARFQGGNPVERVQGARGGVAAEQATGAVLSYMGAMAGLAPPETGLSGLEQMRVDFQLAVERLATHPRLLQTYLQRREAARGRHWSPEREVG